MMNLTESEYNWLQSIWSFEIPTKVIVFRFRDAAFPYFTLYFNAPQNPPAWRLVTLYHERAEVFIPHCCWYTRSRLGYPEAYPETPQRGGYLL